MSYAVIETGGKQYKVFPGTVLEVERLASTNGSITFDRVLLYSSDGEAKIGMPYLEGVTVAAKVLGEHKGEKIRVQKFLAKSRYRRTKGHRQALTRVQIEDILKGGKSTKSKVKSESKQEVSTEEKVQPKKTVPKRSSSVKKTAKKA